MVFQKILNSQAKNTTFAAFILGFAGLLSAILGFLRDRLLVDKFGVGNELDIYYVAFKIPDFIALILIMGSISAAIIPIFSQYLSNSKKEAWDFISVLLNLFLVSFIIISLILIIFTPYLISLIAPGFDLEKKEIAVLLTRIMFLSPIFLGISNMFSGILQVFRRFFITSLAPIMYNLGIILGILFFVPKIGISGLAWGVVFGAFLHLIIQLPVIFNIGFYYKKIFNFKHPGVLNVIKLTIPRSLGLAASQINIIIITAIASTLTVGSIAIFNLANNFIAILISLIAIPFSSAVFPVLSLSFSEKNKEKFVNKFSSVFRQIIFLIIPLSFLFFILRKQIVRVVLKTGEFGISDIMLIASCLGLFSLGILAQGLVLLISKAFFATKNTKTPAMVSIFVVILNLFLSFYFIWLLGFQNIFRNIIENFFGLSNLHGIEVLGLPLAVSISALVQLSLLLFLFKKNISDFNLKEIWDSFKKIIFVSFIMIIIAYSIINLISFYFNIESFLGSLLLVFVVSIFSLFFYFSIASLFKFSEINTIKFLFLNKE